MLNLTEEETGALAKPLSRTIDDDRYPALAPDTDLQGHTRQAQPGAGSRVIAAAQVYALPRATAARRRRRG